jgi:hypothetical protein
LITEQELLEPHEHVIERFNAQIMRRTDGRWVHTVPAIYVLLTDLRLILQPQTRKRYPPAIIPLRYIRMVKRLRAASYGFSLHLKSGPTIYLFASWNSQTDLIELLQVLAEVPYARDYEAPLAVPEIRRLIEFVRDI